MRQTNKSRSRNKNSNNNNNHNNNRRSVGSVVNRVFDSSGPDGKVRGTPQQIIDKYMMLTRDAQLSGDRVAAENFQQHAEHYIRMLGEAMREQNERREQQEAQEAQAAQRREERGENVHSESNAGSQQPHSQPSQSQPSQPEHAGDDAPSDVAAVAAPTNTADTAEDVMNVVGDDHGLVETPESKPNKSRARRRPRTEVKSGDEENVPVAE